ncbi:NUDIX hydrolase [Tamlana sp. 2201CG12-4]|uniref:NUDIX hydrolase n=1 Tax=Tamlana sp. 2201CG12-4 TaxID=3112582 RepID=UPI002DBED159|nr:NUDIX domain-containing protein [Tamlana sp. 2201CG12-4]
MSLYNDSIVDYLIPGNSIDCVIFGYEDQLLKILLLKWKTIDLWALPGGFILKNEDMDKAAHRILKDRSGLDNVFLNQFHTFGNKNRRELLNQNIPKEVESFEKNTIKEHPRLAKWLEQRFITTGYFALVDIKKAKPIPDVLSDTCEWVSVNELPVLIYDHNHIINTCLKHIAIQLNYLPIGISLLPNKFTMQDLQRLYEAFLNKKLERSNFQRKMLKLDIFIRLEKQLTGAANKAPYLYSFNKSKYLELVKKGIGFSY